MILKETLIYCSQTTVIGAALPARRKVASTRDSAANKPLPKLFEQKGTKESEFEKKPVKNI